MPDWNRERLERWQAESRPCREVYPGACGVHVGPPNWDHRINRYRGEVKSHPTLEQALAAARNVDSLPDVLRRLGDWDAELYAEVREAARSNPSYPTAVE